MINCVEKPACKNSNHCKRTSLSTAKEAWSLVTQISELPGELVKVSTFCLLPTSGLSNLKALLFHKNVWNDALSTLVVVLTDQCQNVSNKRQAKHDELHSK
tara:strand:- start:463 stop:765 length:303 start_codon:yes stop_codon:yes gene_type:complete